MRGSAWVPRTLRRGQDETIRAILGLIKPTSGSAEIFGIDTQRRTVESHKRIAYVPGEASFWPNLTGMETLHLLEGSTEVSISLFATS